MAWRSVIAVGQVIRRYGLASEILTPGEEFGSGRKSMGDLIVKLITRYIQMYFIFYFSHCLDLASTLHWAACTYQCHGLDMHGCLAVCEPMFSMKPTRLYASL